MADYSKYSNPVVSNPDDIAKYQGDVNKATSYIQEKGENSAKQNLDYTSQESNLISSTPLAGGSIGEKQIYDAVKNHYNNAIKNSVNANTGLPDYIKLRSQISKATPYISYGIGALTANNKSIIDKSSEASDLVKSGKNPYALLDYSYNLNNWRNNGGLNVDANGSISNYFNFNNRDFQNPADYLEKRLEYIGSHPNSGEFQTLIATPSVSTDENNNVLSTITNREGITKQGSGVDIDRLRNYVVQLYKTDPVFKNNIDYQSQMEAIKNGSDINSSFNNVASNLLNLAEQYAYTNWKVKLLDTSSLKGASSASGSSISDVPFSTPVPVGSEDVGNIKDNTSFNESKNKVNSLAQLLPKMSINDRRSANIQIADEKAKQAQYISKTNSIIKEILDNNGIKEGSAPYKAFLDYYQQNYNVQPNNQSANESNEPFQFTDNAASILTNQFNLGNGLPNSSGTTIKPLNSGLSNELENKLKKEINNSLESNTQSNTIYSIPIYDLFTGKTGADKNKQAIEFISSIKNVANGYNPNSDISKVNIDDVIIPTIQRRTNGDYTFEVKPDKKGDNPKTILVSASKDLGYQNTADNPIISKLIQSNPSSRSAFDLNSLVNQIGTRSSHIPYISENTKISLDNPEIFNDNNKVEINGKTLYIVQTPRSIQQDVFGESDKSNHIIVLGKNKNGNVVIYDDNKGAFVPVDNQTLKEMDNNNIGVYPNIFSISNQFYQQ